MPPEYAIRLALAADVEAIPRIERAAARRFAPWGLDALFASTVTPRLVVEEARLRGHLLVAACADDVIGFAMLSRVDWHASLDEIHVVPEHGRRGVGTALVREVIATARREGRGRLTLATMRDVPFNAPWYRRLGFRDLAPEELGPGLRTAMRRELAGGLPISERVVLGLDLG
jgi:ribosomal protein S18 acetylase RimI-like enzyme